MIATDDNAAQAPDHINNLIRIGAIAHDIPEIPNDVMLGRSGKHSLECLEVRVNVGDDKGAHVSLSFALKLSLCPVQTLSLAFGRPHGSDLRCRESG